MTAIRHLAHWTITQRQIHVILASKSSVLRHEKPILTETVGNVILAARKQAGLTQEKLSGLTGIHRQWLRRWERGRARPTLAEWTRLGGVVNLPGILL